MNTTEHGYKEITVASLLEPDIPGGFPGVTAELWVEEHLKQVLSPNVPKNVVALLEVARGCMIYGFYYYPLITLGLEQCERVMDTAAKERCKQLGIPLTRRNKKGKLAGTTFADNIRALAEQGAISKDDLPRWESTRKLRNMSSHPEDQTVLVPGMTLAGFIRRVALLNRLFP